MLCNTFYALSTISGKSGVAIVRISGPDSLKLLWDMGYRKEPSPRAATFHRLLSPKDGSVLDDALFIYFKSPNSFTGDDVLELHLHGSRAVIKDVLSVLSEIPYIRGAEPGEFSRQAFMNGKMDLTQAEGLAELIEAETSIQKKVALRQMSGEVGSLYAEWRRRVITIIANLEALIDFPGDDIPENIISFVDHQIDTMKREIAAHLSSSNDFSTLSDGIKIVISGPPNAGKSSLMNYIAKSEVAIVSDIAGTTRDIITTKIDLGGFPIVLSDTAGIREGSVDIIEQKGITIAKKAASSADINVVVLDASHGNEEFIKNNLNLFSSKTIVLLNKIDLLSGDYINLLQDMKSNISSCMEVINISIAEGYGIAKFLDVLRSSIEARYTPLDEPLLTKVRYREALIECLNYLNDVDPSSPMLDIVTEDLRMAASAIGRITGEVQLEEILDQIFSSFCIGK